MPAVPNARLVFNEVPQGYPEPGKTTVYDASPTIDPENVPLNGGYLLKVLVVSVDPYLRGKMRDPKIKSYSVSSRFDFGSRGASNLISLKPAFVIGEPLYNYGVGVVLRSELDGVKTGDHIYGILPFEQYKVIPNLQGYRILKNEAKIPWSLYVGLAGMPGKTSYYGWNEYSLAKKGDTVFVSGGAGPVGSIVIQFAKAEGLKVITSAGSDQKVEFVKSLGADVAFNYKTTKTSEVLQKEGPIDVYWDNVGGETLEAALEHASDGARFIECGMISGYNGTVYPVKNLIQIVSRQIKLTGFLSFNPYLVGKYEEPFYEEIPKRLASGEIKYTEDLTHGLENAGKAILDVQTGKNVGKSVVIVSQD
ncbi:hypothetical protein NLI96_g2070 [Meripilus lineatus]|uniref:Enoyl reductase (ER) domain-containing protein n=1 Tax=Meripilus lineatus TaxID=2056292 RepID=A0AAD5VAX7_9APHY|nr:hypothetical protein NLI96_g2070 [Physisporinus lineatus]